MIPNFLRAGILGATAIGIPAFFIFGIGCDRLTPLPKEPPAAPLVVPSANELYVFPHGSLSLSAFSALRGEFPNVAPNDLARIARITQWLRARSPANATPDLAETTRCVRALFLPDVSPADLRKAERFAASALGYSSLDLLRQSAHDAESGWVIEWNPSLAREFGISIPNR